MQIFCILHCTLPNAFLIVNMKLPLGRNITDFDQLTIAEQKLIDCAEKGIDCIIGNGELPLCKLEENIIRASIIRFLLLGGDSQTPVHEKGVDLEGAWIADVLDLDGCKGLLGLVLSNCAFEEYVRVVDGEIQTICFSNVTINKYNEGGISFFADRIRIEGDLQISENSCTEGAVHLGGARIGGVLSFIGSSISKSVVGSHDAAVFADGIQVEGDVFFSNGFKSFGEVRLLGGKIFDSLICTEGTFCATKKNHLERTLFNSDALSLSHCEIGRTLLLDLSSSGKNRAAIINGGLNLQGAKVNNLMDSLDSLPRTFKYQGKTYNGFLVLDGFMYNNLMDLSPTDFDSRSTWLSAQVEGHLNENFRSQPFLQLAKVLRQIGQESDALKVLIYKEKMLSKSGTMSSSQLIWHKVMGMLISYGYRPWRVLYYGLFFWIVGILLFSLAWRAGDIIPAQPVIAMKPEYRVCHEITHPTGETLPFLKRLSKYDEVINCLNGKNMPTKLADMSDYPRYSKIVYPLDVILPIIDFHQEAYWIPSSETKFGTLARIAQWFLTTIGWFLTAIGAATVTGLVRKD